MGMSLPVFLGRLFRDLVPRLSRLGPDDPGQGTAAEGPVNFRPHLVEDVVWVTLEKVLFRPDADLLKLSGSRLADVWQVGEFWRLLGHSVHGTSHLILPASPGSGAARTIAFRLCGQRLSSHISPLIRQAPENEQRQLFFDELECRALDPMPPSPHFCF